MSGFPVRFVVCLHFDASEMYRAKALEKEVLLTIPPAIGNAIALFKHHLFPTCRIEYICESLGDKSVYCELSDLIVNSREDVRATTEMLVADGWNVLDPDRWKEIGRLQ